MWWRGKMEVGATSILMTLDSKLSNELPWQFQADINEHRRQKRGLQKTTVAVLWDVAIKSLPAPLSGIFHPNRTRSPKAQWGPSPVSTWGSPSQLLQMLVLYDIQVIQLMHNWLKGCQEAQVNEQDCKPLVILPTQAIRQKLFQAASILQECLHSACSSSVSLESQSMNETQSRQGQRYSLWVDGLDG